jgi:hypothetical protein
MRVVHGLMPTNCENASLGLGGRCCPLRMALGWCLTGSRVPGLGSLATRDRTYSGRRL